jgi:glutamyl-tRNA synthetase
MPYEGAASRLQAMGVPEGQATAFWMVVRQNCVHVRDAAEWVPVAFGDLPSRFEGSDDDRAFVQAAFDLLPAGPFDGATWKRWTDAVKAATGRKGRALFMPLRQALTGLDHGPDLAGLLPLIGLDRALSRRP